MSVFKLILFVALPLLALPVAALGDAPGDRYDMRYWKLQLPTDDNQDGKVDEVDVADSRISATRISFTSMITDLILTAPNKATTTANSTNTRTELRQMFRWKNTKIRTHDPKNNFALKAQPVFANFADMGGRLEATLAVLHVSKNAKHPDKQPAFAVVVGQIHADKDDGVVSKGFG